MDSLAEKHKREFAEMRSSSSQLLKITLLATPLLILTFFLILRGSNSTVSAELTAARRELLSSGTEWSDEMLTQHNGYRYWLEDHGTSIELNIFDRVSVALLSSAASLALDESRNDNQGFFHRICVSFHSALGRLAFIIIAGMRLWLFALISAFAWAYYKLRTHSGKDLLGETSNGRLFYSGIRVSLDEVDSRGAPTALVTGLACPQYTSLSVARTSEIGKVLTHFKAENQTNLTLAAIILAHPEIPSYVALREEAALLERAYDGDSLTVSSPHLLMNMLELHAEYCAGRGLAGEALEILVAVKPSAAGKIGSEDYAATLQHALHRVVTPDQRKELTNLSAAQLATAVLSLEAAKVMTYAKEAGRWVRRSNFHQLNARSILHSIASFNSDYDSLERALMRRSIIFSSRSSVFAPVRFPIDLDATTRSLRQWLELLLYCPHELQSSADEVELYGLVTELHRSWSMRFFDILITSPLQWIDDFFSTHSNLIFIPVHRLLEMFYHVVDNTTLRRLEALVTMVHQKQLLNTMTLDSTPDSEPKEEAFYSEKFLGPLTSEEMSHMMQMHSLTVSQVRDWSALRVVLNSHAWLARRVGDYTVPATSIIFSVFRPYAGTVTTNEYGLVGRRAMVPLRSIRLQERFGKSWSRHFMEVKSASMAEVTEDFEKRLKGIEDSVTPPLEIEELQA